MFLKQTQLFFDPNLHYPGDDLTLPFDEYMHQCKTLIAHTRMDLTPTHRDQIINANAPFEYQPIAQPIRYGALLTHGLYDSPFQMRDIGLHLQKQGLLVRSLLLPGHGTVPGALLKVTYEDWLQTLHYGFNKLCEDTSQVFLVGNSTGAALSLYYALHYPEKVAGIILISPALKIYSKWAWMTYLALLFKAAWLHQDPKETLDYVKYSSYTYNSVYQVYRLTKALQKIKKHPACPLFFAQSIDDKVINPYTVLRYFSQNPCSQNKLILYSNQPTAYLDSRVTLRQSNIPELHIKNFSHIALPIAPSNPHYGQMGDYPLASHINTKNNVVYGEFNEKQIQYRAYLVKHHLAATQLERLTFNPDFEFLMANITQFIEYIEKN